MDKTRSKNRNRNYHSASTSRRKVRAGPWSDVKRDVLYLVMMQLGVIDFVAFSGVCKSCRSLDLSSRNIFMASRPPMSMPVRDSYRAYKQDCYLEDCEGRKFKTRLPHSAWRYCIGISCGYLILFSLRIYDFWLVNPITRHELHFLRRPDLFAVNDLIATVVLVFSPSLSEWVFVITQVCDKEIWFSTAGQGSWSHVKSTSPIFDLHAFKGKNYTLNNFRNLREVRHVCELSFNPEPKLTILETKNLPNPSLYREFVSSGENLFVVQPISEHEYDIKDEYNINELDFDEMKWVSHGKTASEYAVFLSFMKSSAAVKPSTWTDSLSRKFADSPLSGKVRLVWPNMWYFPHDCFDVNQLDV